MERSQGRREIMIALIDGPVVLSHPDLAGATIREIPGKLKAACTRGETMSCAHGSLVAGLLCARRGSMAPAICPGCTLLVRPIFAETDSGNGRMPNATPEELAEAIVDTVDAGAHVINLSSAFTQPSPQAESNLAEARDHAPSPGLITLAATGHHQPVSNSPNP